MNLRKYRDGQLAGHDTIVRRVKAVAGTVASLTKQELHDTSDQRYTAIVLPTRYGKSDVIRCSAIELFREEQISAALVLSPNTLLRNQIIDKTKFDVMCQRYQIVNASALRYRTLDQKPANLLAPVVNGEFLVSATIQLVNQFIDVFEEWVEHMLYQHHAPVVVFIDEAHTGSEQNKWGGSVIRLVQHGACAVLATATAMRSDGARIPGFDLVPVGDAEQIRQYRTRDAEQENKIVVDVYEGCSQRLKLVAHHTTTFKQAWAERPSPLCRISRLPFDVELSEIFSDEKSTRRLSDLSPAQVRENLGRIVRSSQVIRAGAERLVQQLKALREFQPDAAAIVFVGNDEDPSQRVDEHARRVRDEIESINSSYDVVIATSSDGNEGTQRIEQFAKGRGDVLIVKQMASLGLDISRLKVALDVSSMRSPAAYIQRTMRIATPYPPCEVCVLIAPDDCLNRALFDVLISDEGGEAKAEELTLVRSYTKDRDEGPQRLLFAVDGIAEADFDDSLGIRAAAEQRPDVDQIVAAIPELLGVLSHAQIATRIMRSGLTVGQRIETSINTGAIADDLRRDINDVAKAVINRRMMRRCGRYDARVYAEICSDTWTDVYVHCEVPRGTTLEQIADVAVLQRLRAAWARLDVCEVV